MFLVKNRIMIHTQTLLNSIIFSITIIYNSITLLIKYFGVKNQF
jgi:hypothetical protein